MAKEPPSEAEQNEITLSQAESLEEALLKLTNLPKRQYTQQEIDEARANLALMNDRVFMANKAVAPNELVNDTLIRKNELEQLRDYIKRRDQKAQEQIQKAQEEMQKAQEEIQKAQEEMQKAREQMLITALQTNATPALIEAMCKNAGITETKLAELREQAAKD